MTALSPEYRPSSSRSRDLWLVVTGCRGLGRAYFEQALAAAGVGDRVGVLLTGDATGIDAAARVWARELGKGRVELRVFTANWTKLGKVAGPMRNSAMIAHARGHADPSRVLCLGVLNDLSLGENKGTRDAIAKAQRAQIPCRIFAFDKDGVMREEAAP